MKQKMVALSELTYYKLKERKKTDSFDGFIGKMLTFFAETETDPSQIKTHPTIEIKKDIERVIRIIKAQEKEYFSGIKEIRRFISCGEKKYMEEKAEELFRKHSGAGLTAEELNKFYAEYERLKKENNRLRGELEKAPLNPLPDTTAGGATATFPEEQRKELTSIIDYLRSDRYYLNGRFSMLKEEFDKILVRIINLIQCI